MEEPQEVSSFGVVERVEVVGVVGIGEARVLASGWLFGCMAREGGTVRPGVERIMEAREHKLECGKLEVIRTACRDVHQVRCLGCGREWRWNDREWETARNAAMNLYEAKEGGALLVWKETAEA